jgi:hypothetical protein
MITVDKNTTSNSRTRSGVAMPIMLAPPRRRRSIHSPESAGNGDSRGDGGAAKASGDDCPTVRMSPIIAIAPGACVIIKPVLNTTQLNSLLGR